MKTSRSFLFAATAALLFAIPSANAAALIDSITSSEGAPASATDTAGTVTSITVGGTTYSNLVAPTSLSSVDTVDYVAIGALPTTVDDALGGLNLDTGTLNYDYTVQFGQTVQDTDVFFILNNTTSPPPSDLRQFYHPGNQFRGRQRREFNRFGQY